MKQFIKTLKIYFVLQVDQKGPEKSLEQVFSKMTASLGNGMVKCVSIVSFSEMSTALSLCIYFRVSSSVYWIGRKQWCEQHLKTAIITKIKRGQHLNNNASKHFALSYFQMEWPAAGKYILQLFAGCKHWNHEYLPLYWCSWWDSGQPNACYSQLWSILNVVKKTMTVNSSSINSRS